MHFTKFAAAGLSIAFSLGATKRAFASDLDQWIAQNAIRVDGLSSEADYPQLAFFDRAVETKRIVFLGEASHFVHEKYDYRLILLKRLVARGFSNVGMEMGISDGQRVDDFMASGDPHDLDRVALYGYRSKFVRSRQTAGACPEFVKIYPGFMSLFKGEESWFYGQLRRIGRSTLPAAERVRHFGFDVDTVPGGGYEDVIALVGDSQSEPAVADLIAVLKLAADNIADSEQQRLLEALELIDGRSSELESAIGPKKISNIRLAIRALLESVRFIDVERAKPCDPTQIAAWSKRLMDAMAARERMMYEILRAKLDDLGPDSKIALMGHDFHLSKNIDTLRFTRAEVPDSAAPAMWPSIGEFVTKTLRIPTYSVWMVQAHGFQSNIDCASAECPIDSGADYLGTLLRAAGPASLVPLERPLPPGAAALDRKLSFAVNGGTYSGNVVQNADALFFVETTSGFKVRR